MMEALSSAAARGQAPASSLTKFGVIGFPESLRQEVAGHGIRVTVIEPGLIATEATTQGPLSERFAGPAAIQAGNVARAIVYALAQPDDVSISELVIRPSAATS